MKFYRGNKGWWQSLTAFALCTAVIVSVCIPARALLLRPQVDQKTADLTQGEKISSATATAGPSGVIIQWRSPLDAYNLGFNIYRSKDGTRVRVNIEIIPGAVFIANSRTRPADSHSYSWFDPGGQAGDIYYLESVDTREVAQLDNRPVTVTSGKQVVDTESTAEGASPAIETLNNSFVKSYPAAQSAVGSAPNGVLENQWAIAAKPGLKISIKSDGWYRVTQQDMITAGFNPTVDIRNLRLFTGGEEVAINTNQAIGAFGNGDYLEFYGRGIDVPTSDTRIYYLIADTTAGKRVRGEIQLDGTPSPTLTSPLPGLPVSTVPVIAKPSWFGFLWTFLSLPEPTTTSGEAKVAIAPNRIGEPEKTSAAPASSNADQRPATPHEISMAPAPAMSEVAPWTAAVPGVPASVVGLGERAQARATSLVLPLRKETTGKKAKKNRKTGRKYDHAVTTNAIAPANFDYTVEHRDRFVYFANLLNGDAENFFGRVLVSAAINQTINVDNPDLAAVGPAQLEIALQGVTPLVTHQVNIKLNNTPLGTLNYFDLGHAVQTFDVPLALLQSGANTVTFAPVAGGGVSLIEYARITYPHLYRAAQATGSIQLASQPNVDDMLVVGGNTYVFKTSPATNLQIGIGIDKAATASNIAARINTDTVATHCTAVAGATDVSLLGNPGAGNSITLVVDGVRLTRTAFANADKLKFNLRGTQSLKVDGFSVPAVRLIDYTDPLSVSLSKLTTEATASGYAITIPTSSPRTKDQRLLYAIPDGQFEQPAALTLNQPSTINAGNLSPTITNGADFVILAHKDFIAAMAPLVTARQNQGFTVGVINIEDVYDEFGYGLHGPQAIKDFLAYATTHWTTAPRYVIFAGDASLDPRNYTFSGNFDFVPTKLVDATYNETASDDWLADFDGDGAADIAIGRLPVRTVSDANLVVAKIVNFTPANIPQNALLIADDPGTPPQWDFETASDDVQALLPGSMTVQRVNVRTEPSPAQATADIISGFTQGRAVVNYSGHGNVNVWSGSSIFDTNNASALTNGNKLPLVIVMDCLNGYFHDPNLLSLSEAFLLAPNGGAVAAFASSGLTSTPGQRQMELQLYSSLYGAQPIAVGDAIKTAKAATGDRDVRATWIYFGDPSLIIR